MGCPNAIIGNLAVKQDVKSVNFNIENRSFSLITENFTKNDLEQSLAETSIQEKRQFILKYYSEI
jgi:hypothetical protein